MKTIQPDGWPRPSGYANGVKADGETLFVAGQIGWDTNGTIVGETLADQARQALTNVIAVVEAGGATRTQIVRMTWFVTDMDEYRSTLKNVGAAYRDIMGDHYPAMSLVQVAGLVEENAKVEIEATAILPK